MYFRFHKEINIYVEGEEKHVLTTYTQLFIFGAI